ncbi:MAG: sulfatase [Candidatus Promineifilaceae bacterium]|nr:sulfatase [Candidatus Promineifilaceae bacterium]
MKRANIILLTIDTLRADALGCYGNDAGLTPNIDIMAKEAWLFESAFANGDHTKPSFPALMTSTYGSMYTGCLGPLSPRRLTLAEVLQEAGYTTAGVTTSPLLGRSHHYHRGFDHFIELSPPDFGASWFQLKGAQRLLASNTLQTLMVRLGLDSRPPPVYASAAVVNDAIYGVLEKLSEPFFLWAHYMDPHWPFHLEAQLDNARQRSMAWQDRVKVHQVVDKKSGPSPADVSHWRELYNRAVSYLDSQLGQLMDKLRERAPMDRTAVILTADHGEEFMEHGGFGHVNHNLYDECLRVPWLIAWPDQPGLRRDNRLVSLLDLAPTVAAMCDATGAPNWLGRPLGQVEGELDSQDWIERPVISETWWERWLAVSVRSSQHKLIWRAGNPDRPEVYHLRTDAGEQKNVFGHDTAVDHRLLSEVHRHMEWAATTQTDPTTVETDETVQQRLRDLGYLE